jgi:uncharacterized membrane protein YphA (DoxX/SURF4 family)
MLFKAKLFFLSILIAYAFAALPNSAPANSFSKRMSQEDKTTKDSGIAITAMSFADDSYSSVNMLKISASSPNLSVGHRQLVRKVLQAGLGLGLINVWVFRSKTTSYFRGGNAKSMVEEFAYYGLPAWSMYVVGFIKVSASLFLLTGLKEQYSAVVKPANLAILAMMVGAVLSHLKVGDELAKSIPAAGALIASILIYLLE